MKFDYVRRSIRATLWAALSTLAIGLIAGCGGREAGLPRFDAKLDAVASMEAGVEPASEGMAGRNPEANRKVVYTSDIDLVVDELDVFLDSFEEVIRRSDGYLSDSRLDASVRERRRATLTVRVPSQNYEALLDGVLPLGYVRDHHRHSEDITAEYVDVEARFRNNERLEQRILELLDTQTGEIKDVLAIEKELARVREESERMKARLRVMDDRVDLATITLSVHEERAYEPPERPTYLSRLSRTFTTSLGGIGRLVQAIGLTIVALLPWAALLSVPGYLAYRRYVRDRV